MKRVLDLFSGIGGFSLGLERTGGFSTVAFCEIEPYARRVLAKHWPEVPCYDDVRTLTADRLRADGIAVDVITGGFPCQDISFAGKGAGLAGERSGLWRQIARLIGELRPRYTILENVSALLGRGLDEVLGDLAALGQDAEWHCIPASALGASHRRDRIWIIAYPNDGGRHVPERNQPEAAELYEAIGARVVADSDSISRNERWSDHGAQRQGRRHADRGCISEDNVGHSNRSRLAQWQGISGYLGQELPAAVRTDWRLTEPPGRGADDGLPHRVDRLRCLGNSVVPAIPELIGRAILAAEAQMQEAA